MTSSTTAPATESIQSLIDNARAEIDGEFVPVADCVNLLLDCYNAADDTVREVVTGLLPNFTTGNLRKADEFVQALDTIQVATLDA